jgi:hypothetical protein
MGNSIASRKPRGAGGKGTSAQPSMPLTPAAAAAPTPRGARQGRKR